MNIETKNWFYNLLNSSVVLKKKIIVEEINKQYIIPNSTDVLRYY